MNVTVQQQADSPAAESGNLCRFDYLGVHDMEGDHERGRHRNGGGSEDVIAGQERMRGRAMGFTLVELMILIAIMAIVAAVAIPQFNIWMVRARIQGASGHLQQDLAWAQGYAIRSGYPVQVTVASGGATGCSWTITPAAPNVSQSVPQMPASAFASRYPNTVCNVVLTGSTFSITPTGMVYGSAGTVTSANVTFGTVGNDAASYGYWLVQLSGAGNLRNCATASSTSSVCTLQ
ncbi:MAG: Tfp pilus assembly protein FimT/FimU [Porticoccaceae bacterium]